MLHDVIGTRKVAGSSVFIFSTVWHVEQLSSAWLNHSCRNLPEESLLRHASRITFSLTFIWAAARASKSAAGDLPFSAWQDAQEVGSGVMPESAEWHVKHVVWPVGTLLKVPFFSQKPSPTFAGGFV